MGRRSDDELVEDIIAFLVERKNDRSVSFIDFCKSIQINSATAKKWLGILSFIRMMCPEFYLEEENRNLLIKFPNTFIMSINANRVDQGLREGK
ncbi:MAG: hypothetical protein ACFFDT_10815 [Candidatus Hodarchaeota archaeon]